MGALHDLQLLEPVPIDDDLCTGLVLIEDLGWGARFVLAHQPTLYESGDRICAVRRKIVLPDEAIMPGIAMALSFVASRAQRVAGRRLWVVK